MYKYIIRFIALSDSIIFKIESDKKEVLEEFLSMLSNIFAKVERNGVIVVESLQSNSPETRQKIELFTNFYKDKIPQVNGISAFFRKLKENESYFFLPNIELDTNEYLRISNYLRAIEEGKSFEEINGQTIDLFGDLIQKYKIAIFGPAKVFIGESIKSKRICRFCNNEKPNISFNNKAHAISEGLGNKTIVLYEECDICNSDFSKTIEPDIIQYLSLYRTIYDVKGKGGSKQFLGKNFKITNDDKINVTVNSDEEIFDRKFKMPLNLKLETKNPITLQNIYKCLCKFYLSVIDSKYLLEFKKTIDWINGKVEVDKLPKIGKLISYNSLSKQPHIATYIRKDENFQLPFAVGEFRFTSEVFVFIIPLSSKDDRDFTNSMDYENFLNTFQHYKRTKFQFSDFSNNDRRKFIMELTIKENEKPDNF